MNTIVKNSITPKPDIFIRTRTKETYCVCGRCSCNIIVEKDNYGHGAILLSCIVSELQKSVITLLHERRNDRRFSAYVSFS